VLVKYPSSVGLLLCKTVVFGHSHLQSITSFRTAAVHFQMLTNLFNMIKEIQNLRENYSLNRVSNVWMLYLRTFECKFQAIEVHIIVNTDNWSDVYGYQNSTYVHLANCNFKTIILYISLRSVKLIGWLIS